MISIQWLFLIFLVSTCWSSCRSFPRQVRSTIPHILKCTTTTAKNSITENQNKVCQFCHESFDSRNALFRHLQSNRSCNQQAQLRIPDTKPQTLVFQFSYQDVHDAQSAGAALREAIVQAVQKYSQNVDNDTVTVLGSSQSSLARLRHVALDQEVGCSAAGDILVLRLQGPNLDFGKNQEQQRKFLTYLLETTNQFLLEDSTILLEACKLLTSDKLIHAEQSCTQRVYHYLMPLKWLPDGDLLEQWWIQSSVAETGSHTNRSNERPPSESLLRMKRFLRSAESERLIVRNDPTEIVKLAAGRFGALGDKKRRAWHNFADPQLQGSASPNTKPVWRVLDRARFQVLLSYKDEEAIAVLEFRGDDFLPQQIRRLVGTVLAMTHEWLPEATLEVATRPECFLETALAPPGRLYLVDNRFHWDEMRTGGKSIFESDVDGSSVRRVPRDTAVTQLQTWILDACDNEDVREQERQWLSELQHTVCPRIRNGLEEWQTPKAGTDLDPTCKEKLPPPPVEYQQTLHLLRDIVATGRWPETSVARSSVIGNVDRDSKVYKKGSFTVINPQFRNGLYKNGVGNDALPMGNQLFPELVEAVFGLELSLSSSCDLIQNSQPDDNGLREEGQRVSSHCAINCNAQFTPHVDSGRGAGQSLSMIVGLGDYIGGELGVEGVGHDIRYKPLEFDGWRLRHWTKRFQGERFSLVWFTPELKGDEANIFTL